MNRQLRLDQYGLCYTPWNEMTVNEDFRSDSLSTGSHFGKQGVFVIPPVAPPAILLFLSSLAIATGGVLQLAPINPFPTTSDPFISDQPDLSVEWVRAQPELRSSWVNGSMESAWEGPFIVSKYLMTLSLV
jgi:hypothetical protein